MEFRKEYWKNHGRWVQKPLSGCFWTQWYMSDPIKELFPGMSLDYILFLDGYTFQKNSDLESISKYWHDLYKKGELDNWIKDFEKLADKTKKEHLYLLQSNLPLDKYINELFRTYLNLLGIWTVAFATDFIIDSLVLKENLVSKEEDLLPIIDQSLQSTLLQEQAREVRSFANEILKKFPGIKSEEIDTDFLEKNSNLKKEIEAHVKKFLWFGTHHWEGDAYSIERCLNQIKKDVEGGIKSIEEKKFDLPDNALLRLLSLSAFWRTHCAEITAKVVFGSRSKLMEVGSKFGLSYNDLLWFSSEEVKDIVQTGKLKIPENYEERKKGYGSLVENGKLEIITGNRLKELLNIFVEDVGESSEVKGMVACKGKIVRGKARVLIAPEDLKTFQDGEILVAPETTPDFISVMKMAKAIVTEQGGITSHAAIVSRELGVPCIIGTKIATRVIKTGDEIEVDTEKGMIKILKK